MLPDSRSIASLLYRESESIKDKVIAVLLEELGGSFRFSREQLEDAPDVEIRDLFSTDEIEMRTRLR